MFRKALTLPCRSAGDEDGVFTHVGGEEVAGVGDLGLVAEEEPAAGEDLLQFFLIDVILAEDSGADQSPVGVNQRVNICDYHAVRPPSRRESLS